VSSEIDRIDYEALTDDASYGSRFVFSADRPMLYAMSTYGQEGIERALQILKVSFIALPSLFGATAGRLNPRDSRL
jgi:hypothetical protein